VQYADRRFDSGDVLGRTDGNCIGRFDLRTGGLKPFFPGRARAVHEPVFIPRSRMAEEGDGFLLAVGQNIEQSTTELYVLDARKMEELARVVLPFRSAPQVHGTWASPADLPLR
jgi:carotenoid cleavage dioxygenase